MKNFIIKVITYILSIMLLSSTFTVFAINSNAETEDYADETYTTNGNYYSFTTLQSCKDETGYANPKALSVGDPLVGVKVAGIKLNNFSSTVEKNGVRYFLKTTPDVPFVTLELFTDMNNMGGTGAFLNNDSSLRVPEYGYVDSVGKGLLCVQHVDANGEIRNYCIKDILECDPVDPIILAEEGSYSISLMFETKRQTGRKKVWDNPFKYHWSPVYEYRNYRIDTGTFHLINSNAMAFIFDQSGNELKNGAVTSTGFVLDYANSHYLNVEIKREIMLDRNNSLQETTDIRSNTVGVNKRAYTQPGIYTISVTNIITGAVTTKRILVEDSNNRGLVSAAAYNYPDDFTVKVDEDISFSEKVHITNDENVKTDSPNVVVIICCTLLSILSIMGIVYLILRYRNLYR